MNTLTIAVCLENFAASQYFDYNFNSLGMFNGVPIGASDSGLFVLESGSLDGGANIDAYVAPVKSDLGISRDKWIRRIDITGMFAGDIRVYLYGDDTSSYSEYFDIPVEGSLKRQVLTVYPSGLYHALAWTIEITNLNGSDFSIDSIDFMVIPTIGQTSPGIFSGRSRGTIPSLEISASGT